LIEPFEQGADRFASGARTRSQDEQMCVGVCGDVERPLPFTPKAFWLISVVVLACTSRISIRRDGNGPLS